MSQGEVLEGYASDEADAEGLLIRKRLREQLDRALAGLSNDQRSVFVPYELEELSVPEIAELLTLPLGTVTSRLRWPELAGSSALATLSGTRARLSGNVAILPEPRWEDAQIYPDASDRLVYDVMSAGDLDDDGAAEVITLSRAKMVSAYLPDSEPQIHIHYGVHVPPAAPDVPR